MRVFKLAVAAMLAMGIAACEQQDTGSKQTIGTLLGAAGGAVAGAQFGKGKGQLVGVAIGTLLGGLVGSEIGKSLDRADKLAMERSTQSALESARSGETVTWRNPDTGHAGTVTPQPAYKTSNDQYCREYQQTVTIGGKTENAYGTACRQPDGSWKLVES